MNTTDLILLAAGKGTRAKQQTAKQFLVLDGKPVLIHALEPFERLPFVGRKIITAAADAMDYVESLLLQNHISQFQVVCGGETRQESVRRGLEHVQTPRVITHNAALPFVTEQLIENVANKNDPCVTTVTPMIHALCRGREFASEFIGLEDLMLINTPQSFDTAIFRDCHRRACSDNLAVRTDCELLMKYGHAVRFVTGDPRNIKITTDLDVMLAEALIQHRNAPPT